MVDFTQVSTELILLGLFALVFLTRQFVYFGIFGKVAFKKMEDKTQNNSLPVSVILCARNEGDNLTEFLPKLLSQNYKTFEVIVVNDCSSDNTEDVLREYSLIFPNLKTVVVKEDDYYKHGKKFALMVGIKGAQYEYLLMTDADCVSDSENWISEMMKGYDEGKEIVLGYGAYIKSKSLLNKLIRFDTFIIAIQYLAQGLRGKAYMGVGRNLSYKKELFFKNKGFASHYHLKSGDDDLFINEVANSNNVGVVFTKESFTSSVPAKSFHEWWEQKIRHLQTAPLYKSSSKRGLAFLYAQNYLFYGLFVSLLFFKSTLMLTGSIFLFNLILQLITFRFASVKLNEKDLLIWVVPFEILMMFIYPALHIAKAFAKPNKWKN